MLLAAACSEQATPDAVNRAAKLPANATPVAAAVALGATPLATSSRGVPRLLQGKDVAAAPAATAIESARVHVSRLAPAWGVPFDALPELIGVGEVATQGGSIARIQQVIDGLPVDQGELRVMIGAGGTLVAASGELIGTNAVKHRAPFAQDDAGAIAHAVAYTHGVSENGASLATKYTNTDATRVVAGTLGDVDVQLARAKQAWHRQDNVLVAAWIVEAYTGRANSTSGDLYRTVITADGRRVLEHRSLQSDVAFKYRVFADTAGDFRPADGPTLDVSPHPTGAPNGTFPGYATPSLVEIDGLNTNPSNLPDPWLASTAVDTIGNNVNAYADVTTPTGFNTGDFRASTTGARAFDRAYNTAAEPASSQTQQMAAVTSLFFGINWLHDFWYDAGFTEVAGNGQADNYGRGGVAGDAILAEAQDFSGKNNANMSTPSDGMPPRMQVYLWSGKETRSLTAGAQTPATATMGFGPKNFSVSGVVAVANDAAGVSPSDACEALTGISGKVILADRGNCSAKVKARNVQLAGGVGLLVANNVAGTTPVGFSDDATVTTVITIGTLGITQADGTTMKTNVAAGTVNASFARAVGVDLDGSLDSTLLAHEFGHYLHHRLSVCNTKMCSAMSEGWGDFLALMQLARAGDNLDGAYPFSIYTTQSFTDDPAYYGIRRAPYSTNAAINSLSFRHMAEGEPLPTTHPFLAFGANSQIHNSGEIWASMLWEAYVGLQKAGTSFDATRKKMAKYVVAGLLLSPPHGTFIEIRDSILTAVNAASPADHAIVAAAFAKRGLGSCAIAPAADSTDFTGLVESTDVRGRAVAGAHLTEAGTKCDEDNVLDSGETLKVRVPIANRGHAALTSVTAKLTTQTPGITVVSEPTVMSTIAPYATAEIVAEIKLTTDVAVPTAGLFQLEITAQNGCDAMTSAPFAIRLNADDKLESSATDSFDAGASVWTATASDTPIWAHTREAMDVLDGVWHGINFASESDTSVVSPVVTVGDQAFSVTFSHRHEFEPIGDMGEAFDGGVIELSSDGGTTWNDVSTLGATPGYTKTLDTGNPLGARMAYAANNPSHPQPDTVTLDFGTQLAGKQVQLRFRLGTDGGVGALGWTIDDVAMSGIVGTPFPTQVADTGECGTDPDPDPEGNNDGGCCDAGPLGAGNIGAALGVLALVLRRRRRHS